MVGGLGVKSPCYLAKKGVLTGHFIRRRVITLTRSKRYRVGLTPFMARLFSAIWTIGIVHWTPSTNLPPFLGVSFCIKT